jgi:hypothetical protein
LSENRCPLFRDMREEPCKRLAILAVADEPETGRRLNVAYCTAHAAASATKREICHVHFPILYHLSRGWVQ